MSCFVATLSGLADTADQLGGAQETFDRYGLSVQTERLAAEDAGWADGRTFQFHRSLAGRAGGGLAPPHRAVPARRVVDAGRPARLRARVRGATRRTDRPRVPRRGGRRRLRRGRRAGGGRRGRRTAGRAPRLPVLPPLPDGSVAFTAHVDIGLRPTESGTDVDVDYRITDSTVDSADFVAGIEIGFGQSLDTLAATIAADPDSTDHTGTDSKKRSTE